MLHGGSLPFGMVLVTLLPLIAAKVQGITVEEVLPNLCRSHCHILVAVDLN